MLRVLSVFFLSAGSGNSPINTDPFFAWLLNWTPASGLGSGSFLGAPNSTPVLPRRFALSEVGASQREMEP